MEIIFGAAASLLTQAVKKYFGTNGTGTLAVVLGISLTGAAVYTALVAAGYWESVVQILVYAGAIYTFLIRRFE